MSSPPPPDRPTAAARVPIPPRPDVAPGPSRTPLVVGFVAATVVAIVLSTLAIGALLEGTPTPKASTPTSAPPSGSVEPSPADETEPDDVGAYRFLHETSQGPVRWDPCETISYRLDARAAPPWVKDDLARALDEVTSATGIEFESDGRTTETFFHELGRIRRRGSGPDLLILWVRQERYDAIRDRLSDRRGSIAFALPVPGDFADRERYVGAILVMSERTFGSGYWSRGFRSRYSHGVVLIHELGHVMGLDHVRHDEEQVMYSGDRAGWDVTGFGSGDLEGLRQLGEEQGCLS